MKILYTNFHTGYGGGHTTYITSLIESLRTHYEIWVATPSTSELYPLCQAFPNVHVVDMHFPEKLKQWRDILRTRKQLRIMLEKERFDIVHVNGSPDHCLVMYSLFGLEGKRPLVLYTKHDSKRIRNHPINQLRARYATDHIIAISYHISNLIEGTPYDKQGVGVWIIGKGIDIDHFSPFDTQASQNARLRMVGSEHAGKCIIGSVAGTASNKRWMDMVKAIASLPHSAREKIHILIAGPSPSLAQRRRVARLGMSKHITFAGNLRDVRPCIAALDIGFALSYEIGSASSFACREMMAMGKPVIVTDDHTANISYGRNNGWTVPKRDPATLAKLLMQVTGNLEALRIMGQAARSTSRSNFRKELFIEETDTVYQCLIASTGCKTTKVTQTPEKIKFILDKMLNLLKLSDNKNWEEVIKWLSYKILDTPDETKLEIRSLYGGMGSFNDGGLYKAGRSLDEENAEFYYLRSHLYHLLYKDRYIIKKGH